MQTHSSPQQEKLVGKNLKYRGKSAEKCWTLLLQEQRKIKDKDGKRKWGKCVFSCFPFILCLSCLCRLWTETTSFSALSSVFMITGLLYYKDEYSVPTTWSSPMRREFRMAQALCKSISEEALKSTGTLWIDLFLSLLLKCRAGEKFSRSLVKPLTLSPGDVNLNHPSQVFIQLHQNFQWRILCRRGVFW